MKRFLGFICGLIFGYLVFFIFKMATEGLSLDSIFSINGLLVSFLFAILGFLFPEKIISMLQGIFPY
jgi:hypothetical protein